MMQLNCSILCIIPWRWKLFLFVWFVALIICCCFDELLGFWLLGNSNNCFSNIICCFSSKSQRWQYKFVSIKIKGDLNFLLGLSLQWLFGRNLVNNCPVASQAYIYIDITSNIPVNSNCYYWYWCYFNRQNNLL